jgi:hypothetical protein
MAKKLKAKYAVGDVVWLAEFDNGDEVVPREQATITGVQLHPGEVTYTGTVKVVPEEDDVNDDGVREFSEDQIEGKVSGT